MNDKELIEHVAQEAAQFFSEDVDALSEVEKAQMANTIAERAARSLAPTPAVALDKLDSSSPVGLMSPEQVTELRERSKDDRAMIVGSEVRQLCDVADAYFRVTEATREKVGDFRAYASCNKGVDGAYARSRFEAFSKCAAELEQLLSQAGRSAGMEEEGQSRD